MTDPIDLAPLSADALLTDPRLAGRLAAPTHPLALLPVRLETRYTGGELLVRIYPDQVHVDAHDPRLSAAEQAAGQEFWRAQWRTGNNAERQQRLWTALADRFGAGRAGWVTRASRPANAERRPATEVADGVALATEPTFPSVEVSEDRRTPVARLLPKQWTATAYAGGQVVAVLTGAPITIDPAVGPDLAAPLVADADDDEVAAVDEEMNWLVDFTAAEQLGMALRLPITGPVDLLLVSGVRDFDAATGAAQVNDLLQAQRYSAGLGFLTPDTPTNNSEAVSSGWSGTDPGGWTPEPKLPAAGSFAHLAADALGIVDASFGTLPNAAINDGELAAAMAAALWPGTWGYWLTQFAGADLDSADWARAHAEAFVRPEGPLPTVRVGRQPYGVLPVTSLNRFRGDDRQNRLRQVLAGLRDGAWRPAIGLAPRVGRGDVGADLVDVLRLEGRSDDLTLRRSVGGRFGDNLQTFLGRNLTDAGFWVAARDRNLPLARAAGLGLVPGALVVHEPAGRPVTLPLVSADGDLGFLRALLSADADALAAAPGQGESVLAVLLRQSLLRVHATAAARLLNLPANDAEFYGFGGADLGWAQRRATALTDGDTVRERLAEGSADSALAGFWAAVGTLADASVPSLERHLLGTLDATSHRLDAWVTSLASARLAELRATSPSGLLVGGYGWVEGLRPAEATPVIESVAGEDGPLVRAVDDPGYIHAPSVHQAQVAALLRNAHLAHGGGEKDPFAVSLTSERIRLARWVFDGVRAGRSVGAVLGYLVERDLHERDLDFAILPAREVCPLPNQEQLPLESRRLDGLRLHQLWAGSEDHAVDHLVAMSRMPTDDERRRAIAVLRGLAAAVDAAADALQAEQVHQFARGNLSRAVSTLADVDRGLAPPPDFDFLQTPRTGSAVTHRMAVLLDPDGAPAAGWADPATSASAAAEPALDAWLGRMLGSATGRTVTPADGTPVALDELQIAATDFVRLCGSDGGPRELAARAALVAGLAVETAGLAPDPQLEALIELGRSLAALVTAAKPLDGVALQPPHAAPGRGVDVSELSARVGAARDRVTTVLAAVERALTGTDPEAVRAAVVSAWQLGVGEAGLPTLGSGWTGAGERVRADLTARRATPPARADDVDALLAELRTLLGPGFVALPRFVAAGAAELAASRADQALTGGDPLAAEVWLTRMERVREPLARAGIALREAEALGGPALDLSVAQVPHVPGATWNALPAKRYVDGAASMLLVGGQLVRADAPLAGLLVDEWSEVVPSATETTGVAFRYDPPEAMAPHAILLAVPPVVGEPWTLGSLNQVLVETLELAHLRAVPPAALGPARQYLPASVLAFNTENDVPSTDPNVLTPTQGG